MEEKPELPIGNHHSYLSAVDEMTDCDQMSSSDELYMDHNSQYINCENDAKENSHKFPNLDICLPKWKEVFPWLKWNENSNIFSCRLCLRITTSYFPDQSALANVSKINGPSDVFNVARQLRSHGESLGHCLSWCLLTPNALHSLVSVNGNLFQECNTISHALDVIRVVLCDKQFKFETFIKAIKKIANIIEEQIIDMVKSCTFFSVVADQCRGLIILRIVQHNVRIEEHVLWSYVTVYDKSPMQYLKEFGLDLSKLIIYIANTPCQQCQRCSNSEISRAKLPPRSPSIRLFSCLLWQEDGFRPLFTIINHIVKLWKLFPFIFLRKLPQFNFPYLLTFYFNPKAVLPVLKHFETFRQIFLELYEKQHLLECLGLHHTKLIYEEQQTKFLTILQEILDILSKTSRSRVISSNEIFKLSQALVSLKCNAKGLRFIKKKGDTLPDGAIDRTHDSVVDLVEKFIDENKKVVYYCGNDDLPHYYNLYNTKSLMKSDGSLNIDILAAAFNTVHTAFSNLFTEERNHIFGETVKYYREMISCGIYTENCIDMIDLFWRCPSYQVKYRSVYKIALLGGSLPFQPCRLRKQMFSSFIAEQKYENSFWVKNDASLKPYLLYIHDEMPFLDNKKSFYWWKDFVTP